MYASEKEPSMATVHDCDFYHDCAYILRYAENAVIFRKVGLTRTTTGS